jgi:hypothetical protein
VARRVLYLLVGVVASTGCGRLSFDETAPRDDGARLADANGGDAPGVCSGTAPQLVQTTCNELTSGNGSSLVVTFTNAVSAGNLLVVSTDWDSTIAVAAVTDLLGNAYASLPINRSAAQSAQLFYTTSAAAGANTVRVDLDMTVSGGGLSLYVHELTPSAIDTYRTATGNGVTLAAAGLAVSVASELLLGHAVTESFIASVRSDYTETGTCNGNMTAVKPVTSVAPYDIAFTADTSAAWAVNFTAFGPRCN